MTEEEIRDLIKQEIIDNVCISVSITAEPYTNNEYYNVNVQIEYDGVELNSFGDSIHIPTNK